MHKLQGDNMDSGEKRFTAPRLPARLFGWDRKREDRKTLPGQKAPRTRRTLREKQKNLATDFHRYKK
ncbi:MAG: hypothetical protein NUV44_01165 [Candidatus Scalindua sp.]|nr:hypothetical protein [Candidatus Scalindua sp.]